MLQARHSGIETDILSRMKRYLPLLTQKENQIQDNQSLTIHGVAKTRRDLVPVKSNRFGPLKHCQNKSKE